MVFIGGGHNLTIWIMARYQRASGFFGKVFGVLLLIIALRFINQIVLG